MSAKVNGGAPAARRRAAGLDRPVLAFAKRTTAETPERIVLFSIDGTEYTMPAQIPTGESLKHLLIVRGYDNEAAAAAYLLTKLAGHDALDALLEQADITDADWSALIKVMQEHTFGRFEEQGN